LRLSSHRKEIQEVREKYFPPVKRKGPSARSEGLKEGDRVRIEGLRTQGIVIRIEEPLRRAEVMMGDRRVKVSLSEVVKVSEEKNKMEIDRSETAGWSENVTKEAPSQLNVIGLTVDEALPVVDKFVDQALVHGLEKIQIIHGMGSGRLRNAIGKYLREHQRVKSYGLGDPMKGGGGVTFVELS